MNDANFVVSCLECQGASRIKVVNGTHILYLDQTPIIAARLRPDMKWGFECLCGNDTRLAPEEEKDVKMLVAAVDPGVITRLAPEEEKDVKMLVAAVDPGVITRIVNALTTKPELKFKMAAV